MYCKDGPQTLNCYIVAIENGLYKDIVLKDLDSGKYLIVTVFPNWQGTIPSLNEEGYLEFEYCKAGVTKWYNKHENTHEYYKNTYFQFRQFIKSNKQIDNNQIRL